MRILYIAYPLVPVSNESCGGAEQMLHVIESGMAARGHETWVAACQGSQASGRLACCGEPHIALDALAEREEEQATCIVAHLQRARRDGRPFDLVHDQGGSFWRRAAALEEPVLLTAHLPRELYGAELAAPPANLFVNCVSRSQRRRFADVRSVAGVVPNGVRLERFSCGSGKSGSLLWLGRLCVEKGAHLAIEAARLAGVPLVLAGDVYPFRYHQQYFDREIRPHIESGAVTFVRRPSFERKAALLREARAVLVPSLVDETSSLVAMEAAASGTPVIAYRRGALPEVVEDGKTGFIVDTVEGMVEAIARLGEIPSPACRDRAERHFSARAMVQGYERLYEKILSRGAARPAVGAGSELSEIERYR